MHIKISEYIVYETNLWQVTVRQDFTLWNPLFGAVKLTTNTDPDKYRYSGFGVGFDASASFSLSDGSGLLKTFIWCRYEFIYTYW